MRSSNEAFLYFSASGDLLGSQNYYSYIVSIEISLVSRLLFLAGSSNKADPIFLPEQYEGKPAKMQVLNKIQSLIIPKVSKFQVKTSQASKNQEESKLDDKRYSMLIPQ